MMKRKKNLTALFTILAVIIIAIAGAVYFYQKSEQGKGQNDKSSQSAAAAGGWSTYSDATAGFSFQYPSDWGTPTQTVSDAGTQINFGEETIAIWDYPISTLGTDMTPESFIKEQEALPDTEPSQVRVGTKTGVEISYSDQPGSVDILVSDSEGNIIDIKRFANADSGQSVDDSDFSQIVGSLAFFSP